MLFSLTSINYLWTLSQWNWSSIFYLLSPSLRVLVPMLWVLIPDCNKPWSCDFAAQCQGVHEDLCWVKGLHTGSYWLHRVTFHQVMLKLGTESRDKIAPYQSRKRFSRCTDNLIGLTMGRNLKRGSTIGTVSHQCITCQGSRSVRGRRNWLL